jgi:hypothetical protein
VELKILVGGQLIHEVLIIRGTLECGGFIYNSCGGVVIDIATAHHRLEFHGEPVDAVFVPKLSNARELSVAFSVEGLGQTVRCAERTRRHVSTSELDVPCPPITVACSDYCIGAISGVVR